MIKLVCPFRLLALKSLVIKPTAKKTSLNSTSQSH